MKFIKKQPPVRLIAGGFMLAILLGSLLLMLPISLNDGVKLRYIDSLYTSVSAVCVTGLTTVDVGSTFSIFGRSVIAVLIQIGGLGVATVGAGLIMLMGKKMDLKSRNLVHEAMNLSSGNGVIRFLKQVFITTVVIELAGALLSFAVFLQQYDWKTALGYGIFHSISSFNNAGFDIFGLGTSLEPFRDNVMLNLITSGLIILGGIGFLVIKEVCVKNFKVKKYSVHAKVVLLMTGALLLGGTLFIKLTEGENISWLGAFFSSVTARTAGFSTYSFGAFTNAGLAVMMLLMFIGASSGSTGGGIKTTTFFVIIKSIVAASRRGEATVFKYSVSKEIYKRASVIAFIGISVIASSTFLLALLEPHIAFQDIMFEMVSAFATVGVSTGITADLSLPSKIVSIAVMYIGRLGPLTVASLWGFSKTSLVRYPEGNLAIG
ncbi:MAG: H(+)-transporting ATPase [Clostridia bacterium]|nr:H(+)-transporting ATPase [Clostridia bacterium]